MSAVGLRRSVLVTPVGRGGVARAVELVAPHLPEARVVGNHDPMALLGERGVVHFHGSLRHRALARDLALSRLVRGPVVLQLHGTSARLRDRLPAAFGRVLDAVVVASVDPTVVARGPAWGVPVLLAQNPLDPAAIPAVRAPEPGLVVFVGRCVPEKGLAELVASTRGWPPGARLEVAGEGPFRPDGPRYLGWLDAAGRRDLWARAAALVLPSRAEGAPLAVIEALAAGVPVVAGGVGAVPSLVGDAGILLDDLGPDAIADAVGRVLGAPTPSAADRIRERCAPERVAAEWRAFHALARSVSGSG